MIERNNNRGYLITIEGPDGSGKSTQIEMLKKYFNDRDYEVVTTREPGGTKISEKIRELILDNENEEMNGICEALLYAASRAQLVEQVLKPAINEGKIVLCDRFVHSSLVYQGYARELGVNEVLNVNEFALNGLKADITVMIDIPYELGIDRKRKQKKLDRLENGGDEFHNKVFNGYQQIVKTMKNVVIIDGTKSIEEIHKDIVGTLSELII